jgi:hypothetical protein
VASETASQGLLILYSSEHREQGLIVSELTPLSGLEARAAQRSVSRFNTSLLALSARSDNQLQAVELAKVVVDDSETVEAQC